MAQNSARPEAVYRYRHFGSFRLLLAALVMFQHFSADLAPEPFARTLMPYAAGSMAVLVFFALSGFVITEAIDSIYRTRPVAFFGNRLLRIVPHFLAAVALGIAAHEVFLLADGVRLWRAQPGFPVDVAFSARNVLLNFVGIVPGLDRFMDYNFLDITWAVRVEMAFYIVMAVCITAGRFLTGARGYAVAATASLLVLLPLFVMAVSGRGVAMLQYVPFFVFGAGLYFATERLPAGWIAAGASVPAMLYQYFALPISVPVPDAPPPAIWADLALLVVLFALMVFLAFRRFTGMRRLDRRLGVLTYPLYLYHQDVLVTVLTFTVGYSYFVFVAGMALSIVVSALLCLIIDPVVDYYRDRLRGRSLDGPVIPSQPVPSLLLLPLGGNDGIRGDDRRDHFDQRRQE